MASSDTFWRSFALIWGHSAAKIRPALWDLWWGIAGHLWGEEWGGICVLEWWRAIYVAIFFFGSQNTAPCYGMWWGMAGAIYGGRNGEPFMFGVMTRYLCFGVMAHHLCSQFFFAVAKIRPRVMGFGDEELRQPFGVMASHLCWPFFYLHANFPCPKIFKWNKDYGDFKNILSVSNVWSNDEAKYGPCYGIGDEELRGPFMEGGMARYLYFGIMGSYLCSQIFCMFIFGVKMYEIFFHEIVFNENLCLECLVVVKEVKWRESRSLDPSEAFMRRHFV